MVESRSNLPHEEFPMNLVLWTLYHRLGWIEDDPESINWTSLGIRAAQPFLSDMTSLCFGETLPRAKLATLAQRGLVPQELVPVDHLQEERAAKEAARQRREEERAAKEVAKEAARQRETEESTYGFLTAHYRGKVVGRVKREPDGSWSCRVSHKPGLDAAFSDAVNAERFLRKKFPRCSITRSRELQRSKIIR